MDIFFLAVMGIVLAAFVVYIIASMRIERCRSGRVKANKGINPGAQ